MAVGMVMTPATAAAAAPAAACGGAQQQQRQHHPTFLPLMIGASQQRRGGSRGQTQWAPLTVRSIATGPPKSAGALNSCWEFVVLSCIFKLFFRNIQAIGR